jgi:hypothetical protein
MPHFRKVSIKKLNVRFSKPTIITNAENTYNYSEGVFIITDDYESKESDVHISGG